MREGWTALVSCSTTGESRTTHPEPRGEAMGEVMGESRTSGEEGDASLTGEGSSLSCCEGWEGWEPDWEEERKAKSPEGTRVRTGVVIPDVVGWAGDIRGGFLLRDDRSCGMEWIGGGTTFPGVMSTRVERRVRGILTPSGDKSG